MEALFPCGAGASQSLDPIVEKSDLWEVPADKFIEENEAAGFRWVSSAHDAAETKAEGTLLFDMPVNTALARFEGGKLREIDVLFYNRGDAGDLSKEKFQDLLKQCVDALSNFTKAKPVVRGKDASNAVKAEGVEWENAASKFLLEYSFTREVKTRNIPFRAEFVRLEVTPIQKPQSLVAASLAAAKKSTRFSGPEHVKREPSGDVVLAGVPMVDQGDKGYCVVAAAERVMRYYGSSVDEHELAQIANTSATQGTSIATMYESLKKLSNRLRIKVRTIDELDVKQILSLVADYNRVAKRGKRAPEIDISNTHVLDVMEIYHQMKPDVLREARNKSASDVGRFTRAVESHIDQGIPLLWSVMLGLVPEEKAPQAFGGHTRLIIGYNEKTSEILYSDSWGAGHELKRMPVADAWTITLGLNSIEPL